MPPEPAQKNNKNKAEQDRLLRHQSLGALRGNDKGAALLKKAADARKKGDKPSPETLSGLFDAHDKNSDGKLVLAEVKPLVAAVFSQVKADATTAMAEVMTELMQEAEGDPMAAMMIGMIGPMLQMMTAELFEMCDQIIADPTETA